MVLIPSWSSPRARPAARGCPTRSVARPGAPASSDSAARGPSHSRSAGGHSGADRSRRVARRRRRTRCRHRSPRPAARRTPQRCRPSPSRRARPPRSPGSVGCWAHRRQRPGWWTAGSRPWGRSDLPWGRAPRGSSHRRSLRRGRKSRPTNPMGMPSAHLRGATSLAMCPPLADHSRRAEAIRPLLPKAVTRPTRSVLMRAPETRRGSAAPFFRRLAADDGSDACPQILPAGHRWSRHLLVRATVDASIRSDPGRHHRVSEGKPVEVRH